VNAAEFIELLPHNRSRNGHPHRNVHPQIDRVAGRELGIMLRVTYVTSFAHCLFVTLWQVLRLRRVHRSYVMQCVN
jgi:hypothetical protein